MRAHVGIVITDTSTNVNSNTSRHKHNYIYIYIYVYMYLVLQYYVLFAILVLSIVRPSTKVLIEDPCPVGSQEI